MQSLLYGYFQVNAMYVPPENSIWIPLGIQRPPFYQYDSIQALNYGALGLVLGHEMTHGFDNMGALYDAHGNFKNWWTNATRKEFQNKQKCFIEEYGNYNFPILDLLGEDYHGPKNVSGTRTLGENIAGIYNDKNLISISWDLGAHSILIYLFKVDPHKNINSKNLFMSRQRSAFNE